MAQIPSMNIQISSSSTRQTKRIDLSRLPVTNVDKGSKGLALFLMVFACLWGGLPTAMLIKSIAAGKMQPAQLPFLVFTIGGIGLFIGGLYLLGRRVTTTISHDQVSVSKKTVFGENQWTAPFSSYTGIRYRSEYHSGSDNSPSYTLYIIELLHPDSKKTVRLYEARTDAGARGIWEETCRTLDMPAVEGEGSQIVMRAVEDLDKSVKELAHEGKLRVDFDPSKPPPMGLVLKVDGKFLELSVSAKKGANVFGGLMGVVFAGVFVYIGFFVKNAPVIFGIVGVVIMLIVIGATIWSLITTEQILVAKDELHLRRQTPWGPTKGTRLDAAAVEVVRVGKRNGQGHDGILIETNAGTTLVAAGLPAPALEWLKNCILKVISA